MTEREESLNIKLVIVPISERSCIMPTTLKRSRQREAIYAYLLSHKDHPTADMVYSSLRETMPNISLGTVYRNLSLLAERGDILKLSCDGKVDHFDATTTPHLHFLCLDCGCVQDIDYTLSMNLDAEVAKHFDGVITNHSIVFEGYCTGCKHLHKEAH